MFNIFEDVQPDINFIIQQAGKDVTINDQPMKALITMPRMNRANDNEDRYIATLTPIERGDTVKFEEENFIIITETATKRHGKYKALMRHSNCFIELPGEEVCVDTGKTDWRGAPIYDCHTVAGEQLPCIVDSRTFAIDSVGAISLPTNQIQVVTQDKERSREKLTINFEFPMLGKTWKIINVDLVKNGLLILTCEQVVGA